MHLYEGWRTPGHCLSVQGVSTAIAILGTVLFLFLATTPPRADKCNHSTMNQAVANASSKALLIVEPRRHELLRYSLHNVHGIMPLEYDLYIYHGYGNDEYAREQAKTLLGGRRIFYRVVNDSDVAFDSGQYNRLLKNVTFWGEIYAEDVLVFQTDSVLCANSPFRIENFLQYSYIGCSLGDYYATSMPWWGGNPFYGVGGLTFRKNSFHVECIKKYSNDTAAPFPEDLFYSYCLHQGHGHKPENATVMLQFCTQMDFRERTFAVHKIFNEMFTHYPGNIPKLLKHCPEALAIVPEILCTERVRG
jgi:hypothetical protein